ncbi:MAG: RNA polymerase sigma factor RpoS [Halothiobacillaceae bacterium]
MDESLELAAPQCGELDDDFDEAQQDAELTAEQESEPQVIYDRGERADITRLYLHDVECHTLLSPEEEQHYARLALKGDPAARERMIVCNLRLVVKIARRYMYRGLELADLIEEGNLGLLRAVEKFDPERGFRFSTYGTWWIRQTIERALMNQGRTVRLPIHIAKELNAYKRAARKITQNQHHEASAGEIAEVLERDVGDVQRHMRYGERITSMSTPLHDDPEHSLLEMIPDENNIDPAELLQGELLNGRIGNWLQQLDTKQREVIERRFGLRGHEPHTLEAIGEWLGVTRERVRQIQIEALGRLRRMMLDEGQTVDVLLDA